LLAEAAAEVVIGSPHAPTTPDASPPSLLETARLSGPAALVTGSIHLQNESIQLEATVTEVGNGTPIFAVGPIKAPRDAPEQAISSTFDRIVPFVVVHLLKTPRLASTTEPPTLEALREWRAAALHADVSPDSKPSKKTTSTSRLVTTAASATPS